ncbi:MAG: hypothetical protein PVSMB1_13890 [Gemmatimonadaceae bacterium]
MTEDGHPELTFGRKGLAALWRIVQHAIADPDLQRRYLAHLATLAGTAEDSPLERAMLSGRIRVYEGKPEQYGTQLDWSEDGVPGIWAHSKTQGPPMNGGHRLVWGRLQMSLLGGALESQVNDVLPTYVLGELHLSGGYTR